MAQPTLTITGTFNAITKYQKMKLLIESDELLKQFQQKHNLSGSSPIQQFECRDGSTRHTITIKLPPKYLKIARNYDMLCNLIDCRLAVTLKANKYDFEKDNTQLKGWNLELLSFRKLEDIPPPPPLTRQ